MTLTISLLSLALMIYLAFKKLDRIELEEFREKERKKSRKLLILRRP